VWAHATYGQMVLDGHDPYTVRPSEIPANTYTRRMAPGWKDVKAVYGPVFIALATAGAFVARTSTATNHAQAVLARLWFQLLAAAALICALIVLWRSTGDPTTLVALGLSPVVTIGIVHEAHPDLLIGFGLLGALVLARTRPTWAAVAAAATVLVKIAALLPLGALMVWVATRHGWRTTLRSVAMGGLILLAGFGAVGGLRAVKPVLAADRLRSHSSLWSLDLEVGPFDAGSGATTDNRPAEALVLLLAATAVVAHRRDQDGAVIVTSAGLGTAAGCCLRPRSVGGHGPPDSCCCSRRCHCWRTGPVAGPPVRCWPAPTNCWGDRGWPSSNWPPSWRCWRPTRGGSDRTVGHRLADPRDDLVEHGVE
jgi:hypothetical protein